MLQKVVSSHKQGLDPVLPFLGAKREMLRLPRRFRWKGLLSRLPWEHCRRALSFQGQLSAHPRGRCQAALCPENTGNASAQLSVARRGRLSSLDLGHGNQACFDRGDITEVERSQVTLQSQEADELPPTHSPRPPLDTEPPPCSQLCWAHLSFQDILPPSSPHLPLFFAKKIL